VKVEVMAGEDHCCESFRHGKPPGRRKIAVNVYAYFILLRLSWIDVFPTQSSRYKKSQPFQVSLNAITHDQQSFAVFVFNE
jgi:hypothetical protein